MRLVTAWAGLWLAAAAPAPAEDACRVLSFDPLGDNVPECTRLLAQGELSPDEEIELLAARAEAYLWARTYHFGHDVALDELPTRAVADLDRAVALARKAAEEHPDRLARLLERRAEARAAAGALAGAAEDYTERLSVAGQEAGRLLAARAHLASYDGRVGDALADLNAAIRLDTAATWRETPDRIFERGRLHETSGNQEAAAADFRRTLELRPDHGAAREALERLGIVPR